MCWQTCSVWEKKTNSSDIKNIPHNATIASLQPNSSQKYLVKGFASQSLLNLNVMKYH